MWADGWARPRQLWLVRWGKAVAEIESAHVQDLEHE